MQAENKQKIELVEIKKDDLTIILGIDEKIEKLLNSSGVHTLSELADIAVSELTKITEHVKTDFLQTWPTQAHISTTRKNQLREVQYQIKTRTGPYRDIPTG